MKRHVLSLLVFALFSAATAQAQLRDIPQAVKDSFSVQYPGSGDATFIDNIVNVQVKFEQQGAKKMATYSNKGQWKETETAFDFENLNAEIKDGFAKSRYSGDGWKVSETKLVNRPGNVELYRVKVQKSELQKKYLYFNEGGKLVTESLTL